MVADASPSTAIDMQRDARHKDLLQVLGSNLLMEVFAWLASDSAVKCAASCQSTRNVLCQQALSVWASSADLTGVHSDTSVWLHTIATAQQISSYMVQVQKAWVLKPLHFQSSKDLVAMGAAVDSCLAERSGAQKLFTPCRRADEEMRRPGEGLFACEFHFDEGEIEKLQATSDLQYSLKSSTTMQLEWDNAIWNHISFELRLVLRKVGERTFVFAWEVSSNGLQSLLMQDSDILDARVNGYINASRDACASTLRILPYETTTSHSTTAEGDTSSHVAPDALIFQRLCRARSVTCAVSFDLRCMGQEQAIACTVDA